MKKKLAAILLTFFVKGKQAWEIDHWGKHLFKLILAGCLMIILSIDQGLTYDEGCCCQKIYGNGKYERIFPVWSKPAEHELADTEFNLGFMYANGIGVQQDYVEAVKWYRKSAEQGNAYAQYNLGLSYWIGQGIERDYAKAVKWFQKSAEQGCAYAQFFLGSLYALGKDIIQSNAGAASDRFYSAGLSFLKEGKKAYALRCVNEIKRLNAPNAFLANKLFTAICECDAPNALPAPHGKSE